MTQDATNPTHYTQYDIQPIDVIEDWNLSAHLANVVKYIARHHDKGTAKEDMEKARWYLDRYIEWQWPDECPFLAPDKPNTDKQHGEGS